MDSVTLNKALALYQSGNIDEVANLLDIVTPHTPNVIPNIDKNPRIAKNVKNLLPAKVLPNNQLLNDRTVSTEVRSNNQIQTAERNAVYDKILGSSLPPDIENAMLHWLKLDEDAAKLRKIKRQIDDEKSKTELQIKHFMANWKISEIGPDEAVSLCYEVKESRQGYSKKFIEDCLHQILPDAQSQKLIELLEANRQVTEKSKLKLKKPTK